MELLHIFIKILKLKKMSQDLSYEETGSIYFVF